MTLPTSGAISSTQINNELGTSSFSVPTSVRVLCRKPSGAISWPADFYGEALHPNVVSLTRFGGPSPGSTFTIPTDLTPAVTGNCYLVVAFQYAESTTATAPADVTPSGWTAFVSRAAFTTADGHGASTKGWFRFGPATLESDVITVMNGTARSRICAIIYSFDKPIGSVGLLSAVHEVGVSALTTSPNNLLVGTQAAGTHIAFGAAHGETSMADSDFVWAPAPVGAYRQAGNSPKGGASVTRTYYSAYDNDQTVPASIRMDMLDQGTFNAIGGCLLRVRN